MFEYNRYSFSLVFEKKVPFRSLPSFIFRNNIGFQLKKITCVLKRQECADCILKASCIYCSVFETPIEKNNSVLEGRNKAPHPYIIYADAVTGAAADRLMLDIILMGTGVRYFPYMLLTMINIGKSGILKERFHFDIDDVTCRDVSVLDKSNYSCKNVKPAVWNIKQSVAGSDSLNGPESFGAAEREDVLKTVKINFLTPVRIQHKGKYLSRITYKDIMHAAARRVEMLVNFFGNGEAGIGAGAETNSVGAGADAARRFDAEFIDSAAKDKEFDADLKWVDYARYSARQKQSMQLGGLVGAVTVRGRFSELELLLLKAAELFSIGKNVSFGLGRVGVEMADVSN